MCCLVVEVDRQQSVTGLIDWPAVELKTSGGERLGAQWQNRTQRSRVEREGTTLVNTEYLGKL
ncbi:MAG: hypothetical protein DHS20C01_33830 [marine bacterium B5-7]|nr:MAG: hypothetical protein DHS20C01_33830 [marine bacterium B5-7]